MTWATIYQFPLRSREGYLTVSASAPPCRDDIVTLRRVLDVGLDTFPDSWPTLEEVQSHRRCSSCPWRGPEADLVPREASGKTGCPLCGCATIAEGSGRHEVEGAGA